MIDFETKIFNAMYSTVAPLCADNKFLSIQIVSPTVFPSASLVELSNRTVRNRQSSAMTENFARVMYQLDVYAASKQKCREVFAAADSRMIAMNFERITSDYVNNPDNTKVHRYVARYEAEIDPNGNIYRQS